MRLVQRHGRIDRIGQPTHEVFLRCFFPDRQLDELLGLEERLHRKITQAAQTIGVGARSCRERRCRDQRLHRDAGGDRAPPRRGRVLLEDAGERGECSPVRSIGRNCAPRSKTRTSRAE